jgi:CheY-like chemotaxis protein
MIVDDVDMNLYVAEMLIKPYGVRIDLASSGAEAVSRIKEGNDYDVIFMDHMMPGMDGFEATSAIRGLGYKNAIIALTANVMAGHDEIFLTNGFDGFMEKPINTQVLNSLLNKHIRDKQRPGYGEQASALPAFDIPGLNTEQGLGIFDGNTDDYIAALHAFIRNVPQITDKLSKLTKDSLPEYAINVHGLKSICAYIGAESLRAKAEELEHLAKAGDLDGALARNGGFLSDVDALMARIKASPVVASGE